MLGMATKPALRVAAPDSEAPAFVPSPIQSRYRDSMRKGIEQNQYRAEQWSRAHFLEFKESVTAAMYDGWMENPAFAEWFADGLLRARSPFELALMRGKADEVRNALLGSEDKDTRLRAATSILGIKDPKAEKSTARPELTGEQKRERAIRELRGTSG